MSPIAAPLLDVLSHDLIDGSLIVNDYLALLRVNSGVSLCIDRTSRLLAAQFMSS